MNIKVISESAHYVLIEAPMAEDGTLPTRENILPVLEQLRAEGFRFLCVAGPVAAKPAMMCERIEPVR